MSAWVSGNVLSKFWQLLCMILKNWIYHKHAEIHNFPTTHICYTWGYTWGRSFGQNGSTRWFSPKKLVLKTFWWTRSFINWLQRGLGHKILTTWIFLVLSQKIAKKWCFAKKIHFWHPRVAKFWWCIQTDLWPLFNFLSYIVLMSWEMKFVKILVMKLVMVIDW